MFRSTFRYLSLFYMDKSSSNRNPQWWGQNANVLSCLNSTCLQVGSTTSCYHRAPGLSAPALQPIYQLQPGLFRSVLLLQSRAPFLLLPFIHFRCVLVITVTSFALTASVLPAVPKLQYYPTYWSESFSKTLEIGVIFMLILQMTSPRLTQVMNSAEKWGSSRKETQTRLSMATLLGFCHESIFCLAFRARVWRALVSNTLA